jgi:hypothetical protein
LFAVGGNYDYFANTLEFMGQRPDTIGVNTVIIGNQDSHKPSVACQSCCQQREVILLRLDHPGDSSLVLRDC